MADELGQIQKSAALTASLERAHRLATEQGHSAVTLEHLLFAMTDDPEAATVLVASGLSMDRLRTDVSAYLSRISESLPRATGAGAMPNPDLLRVLNLAATAARQSQRANIDGAIVLAAVVGDGNTTAAGLLKAQGLTFEEVIKVLSRHAAHRAQAPGAATQQATASPPSPAPSRAATPVDENLLETVRERVRRSEPPKIAVRGPAVTLPQREEKATAAAAAGSHEPSGVSSPTSGPSPDSIRDQKVEAQSPPRIAPPSLPRPAQAQVHSAPALQPADPGEGPKRPPLPPSPPVARNVPPPVSVPEAMPPQRGSPVQPAPSQPPMGLQANGPFPSQQTGAVGAVGIDRTAPNLPAPEHRLAEYRPEVRGGPPLPAHMLPPVTQQAPAPYAQAPQGTAPPQQQPAYQPPVRLNDGGFAPPRPDMGQAVTGIPETMVVGHPSLVEVQFAATDFLVAARGRGAQASRARPIRAISVRLSDEGGAFTLEAESPETLWLDAGQPGASIGTLNWSFAVTPCVHGRHKLGLVVTSRVIGPLGFVSEPPIPAEAVDVRVYRDKKSAAQRAIITIAAALAGAAVWATAGSQIVSGIAFVIRAAGLR